jgi:hypothetical protein
VRCTHTYDDLQTGSECGHKKYNKRCDESGAEFGCWTMEMQCGCSEEDRLIADLSSTIATLRKAVLDVHDALHRECSGDVDLPAEIRALRSRITADAERIERLRGYAEHDANCGRGNYIERPCNCGLSDLLGEVE